MSEHNLCSLPPLFVKAIDQWQIIRVSGEDASAYLQGQLSCDVSSLSAGQHSLAAHCDPKGKTWSVLRLLKLEQDYLYIQPKALNEVQVPELKKYAVFSKVEIEQDQQMLCYAVLGEQSSQYIAEHFGEAIAQHGGLVEGGICLQIEGPKPRYLLVLSKPIEEIDSAGLDANQVWKAAQIVSGLATLAPATAQQFIPQALNLQCLEAISFSKGCYTGQETIARAKYRGINKRATFRLAGKASQVPEEGADLELQLGENWRRKGTVLQAVEVQPGHIELLAVLGNDADAEQKYRLADDEQSLFTVAHLPYSLEQD